jgi:hypothetical protein
MTIQALMLEALASDRRQRLEREARDWRLVRAARSRGRRGYGRKLRRRSTMTLRTAAPLAFGRPVRAERCR